MAVMPRVGGGDPNEIVAMFIQALQRRAAQTQRQAFAIEEADFRAGQDELQRRFGASEWDRRHKIGRGEQLEDRAYTERQGILTEDRRRAENDRLYERSRGDKISDEDRLRIETDRKRGLETEDWIKRQEHLKKLYPDRYSYGAGRSQTTNPDRTFGGNVVRGFATEDDAITEHENLPDKGEWEIQRTVDPDTAKPEYVLKRKGFQLTPEMLSKDYEKRGGTTSPKVMPDPAAGAPKSGKGDRSGALDTDLQAQFASLEGDLAEDNSPDSIRSGVDWLTSARGKPYQDLIVKVSDRYGLDPNMVASVLMQESGFKERARSPAGAMGIAQIMPGTARDLGVNPWNPREAILGAAKYLARGLQRYDGNIGLALAHYNAGPGNVDKGRFPAETRNYVRSITGRDIRDWIRNGNSGDSEGVTIAEKDRVTRRPKTRQLTQGDDPLFYLDV